VFVGVVALVLVPWTARVVMRGLREGRLPLGRSYISRDRPGAFGTLIAFYAAAGLMAAFIAMDLLFKIRIGSL
jgi:hypothetical protein